MRFRGLKVDQRGERKMAARVKGERGLTARDIGGGEGEGSAVDLNVELVGVSGATGGREAQMRTYWSGLEGGVYEEKAGNTRRGRMVWGARGGGRRGEGMEEGCSQARAGALGAELRKDWRATKLAASEASASVIQREGGWPSEALMVYVKADMNDPGCASRASVDQVGEYSRRPGQGTGCGDDIDMSRRCGFLMGS